MLFTHSIFFFDKIYLLLPSIVVLEPWINCGKKNSHSGSDKDFTVSCSLKKTVLIRDPIVRKPAWIVYTTSPLT